MDTMNLRLGNLTRISLARLLFVGCISILTACGGGGGDGTDTNNKTPILLSTKVSGLLKPGLVLQNNGTDDLYIQADGLHTFKTPIADKAYKVTVNQEPNGIHCTVVGGGIGKADIGTTPVVNVACSEIGLNVSGVVDGLNPGNSVTLTNNVDDTLVVTGDGAFTFDKEVAFNSGYNVEVTAQPSGQNCSVQNGWGEFITNNIDNIVVTCTDTEKVITISGNVTGLKTGLQLTLLNNRANPQVVAGDSDGDFSFNIPVNGNYLITVGTQPSTQICSPITNNYLQNNVTSNVSNVNFTCHTQRYTVTGTLTGLPVNSSITLDNNGTPTVLHQSGPFSLTNSPVALRGSYNVTVAKFPFLQNCQVLNGAGNHLVTNVSVDCSAPVFSYLHNFGLDNDDGAVPGDLIQGKDGNFYGTTQFGGDHGGGTLFKMTPGGSLTTLTHFGANKLDPQNNSVHPVGQLIFGQDGYLYGVSQNGGGSASCSKGCGTIFRVNPKLVNSSTVEVLHAFTGLADGSTPMAGLIEVGKETFYGTASYGGAHNYGVVFKVEVNPITKKATYTNLHSFTRTAGSVPLAGLIHNGNLLYGTTQQGGVGNGAGTIFSITLNGDFESLYSFKNGEGFFPESALLKGTDGYLYGTTRKGGTSDRGSIYRFNPSNQHLDTLFSFAGDTNGGTPYAKLVLGDDGNFYGTTSMANNYQNGGTIFRFSLTSDGKFNSLDTLYSFKKEANVSTGLTRGNDGSLYGTIPNNNEFDLDWGAVYKIGAAK